MKPGSDAAYSNSAFVILGRIIEKISGLNWWDYFCKNIFDTGRNEKCKSLPASRIQ